MVARELLNVLARPTETDICWLDLSGGRLYAAVLAVVPGEKFAMPPSLQKDIIPAGHSPATDAPRRGAMLSARSVLPQLSLQLNITERERPPQPSFISDLNALKYLSEASVGPEEGGGETNALCVSRGDK